MYRNALVTLAVITAGLSAQSPMKTAKPPTTAKAPVTPPAPPAAPAPAPTGAMQSANTSCRETDLTGQWTSPRALMTRCLNKVIVLGSDPSSYTVTAVTDAGFVVARVNVEASGQKHNQRVTRFIPWSSVVYFGTIGEFVDVVLIPGQT